MTRDSTGVLIPTGVAESRSRSQSSQTTIHWRSARWTIMGWWTFRICSTPTPTPCRGLNLATASERFQSWQKAQVARDGSVNWPYLDLPTQTGRCPAQVTHAQTSSSYLRGPRCRCPRPRDRAGPPGPHRHAEGWYQGDRPVGPGTADALDLYVDGRESGPLFCTASGGRWHRSEAWRTLRRLAKEAVPDKADSLHHHDLRHTFVTLGLDAGASLRDV
jgi:hypothetical protein